MVEEKTKEVLIAEKIRNYSDNNNLKYNLHIHNDTISISIGTFEMFSKTKLIINISNNSLRFLRGTNRNDFKEVIKILNEFGIHIPEENYIDENELGVNIPV
ncbi:MAG: hypothetical protein VXZ40_03220 [Nanoarchaeota archaeon]|nr:hypothetical protein [Nanoarchaeota archaeon]